MFFFLLIVFLPQRMLILLVFLPRFRPDGQCHLWTSISGHRCPAWVGWALQLGLAAFGKWGQVMVDVSLVLSQLSFCCSYFIFIVLNIPSIAPVPAQGSAAEYLLSPDVLIALQVYIDSPAVAAASIT